MVVFDSIPLIDWLIGVGMGMGQKCVQACKSESSYDIFNIL